MSFLIVSTVGYPNVMNGLTLYNIFNVALLTLRKVPLCNYLNLNNFKIVLTFGCKLLIPLILTTKITFASGFTYIDPSAFAFLLFSTIFL